MTVLAFGSRMRADEGKQGPRVVLADFAAVFPVAGGVAIPAVLAHAPLVKIGVAIGAGTARGREFKIDMAGPATHVDVGFGERKFGLLVVETDFGGVDCPVHGVVAEAAVHFHGRAVRTLRGADALGGKIREQSKDGEGQAGPFPDHRVPLSFTGIFMPWQESHRCGTGLNRMKDDPFRVSGR